MSPSGGGPLLSSGAIRFREYSECSTTIQSALPEKDRLETQVHSDGRGGQAGGKDSSPGQLGCGILSSLIHGVSHIYEEISVAAVFWLPS